MTQLTYGDAAPDGEGWRIALRGLRCRCPRCGEGRLFSRFLKVAPACEVCGQPFHHHRADDFPPYIVMFIVGHVVGYGIYVAETRFEDVPLWLHAALWPSLAIALCLGLLQPVKGFVVALQYALGMHGFTRESGGPKTRTTREADGERPEGGTADGLRVERRAGAPLAEPEP